MNEIISVILLSIGVGVVVAPIIVCIVIAIHEMWWARRWSDEELDEELKKFDKDEGKI